MRMQFSDLAARLDALEDIQGEWPGFGPKALSEAIAATEAEAMAATPATADDRDWLYARFERALVNGWSDEAKAPLLSALGRARVVRGLPTSQTPIAPDKALPHLPCLR